MQPKIVKDPKIAYKDLLEISNSFHKLKEFVKYNEAEVKENPFFKFIYKNEEKIESASKEGRKELQTLIAGFQSLIDDEVYKLASTYTDGHKKGCLILEDKEYIYTPENKKTLNTFIAKQNKEIDSAVEKFTSEKLIDIEWYQLQNTELLKKYKIPYSIEEKLEFLFTPKTT